MDNASQHTSGLIPALLLEDRRNLYEGMQHERNDHGRRTASPSLVAGWVDE